MGAHPFDPSRYLRKLGGKDYLEVKWRLVWLRREHPAAVVKTRLVHLDWERQVAVFHAIVKTPGGGHAEGWGSESFDDFGDWLEKAETKALGRALAALGYGTQFCDDHEFGGEDRPDKVVDSPVERPSGSRSTGLSTPAQLKLIYLTATRDCGLSEQDIDDASMAKYGRPPVNLTKREASELIDALKSGRIQAVPAPSVPEQPRNVQPPTLPATPGAARMEFDRLVQATPKPDWAGSDAGISSFAKALATELEARGMSRDGRMAMYEALTGFTSGVSMDPRQLQVIQSLAGQVSVLEAIGQAHLKAHPKAPSKGAQAPN